MTQFIEQIFSLSEEQKIQLIHALSERSASRTVKDRLPFTLDSGVYGIDLDPATYLLQREQIIHLLQ